MYFKYFPTFAEFLKALTNSTTILLTLPPDGLVHHLVVVLRPEDMVEVVLGSLELPRADLIIERQLFVSSTEQLGPSPQNHRATHELHRAARCSVLGAATVSNFGWVSLITFL